MKTLAEQMSVYHQYHRKGFTRFTHFFGVPLIVFAVMVLLNWVNVSIPGVLNISLMWLLIVATFIYYLFLNVGLAIGMLIIFSLLAIVANHYGYTYPNWQGFYVFLATFAGGWILQLIGHAHEGRKPALLDNLFQMIIAPIFLLAELCFLVGLYRELRRKVEAVSF